MTEEEANAAYEECLRKGYIIDNGDGTFSLTPTGRAIGMAAIEPQGHA